MMVCEKCKLYDARKFESQPGRKGTTVIASLILMAQQTRFVVNQIRQGKTSRPGGAR